MAPFVDTKTLGRLLAFCRANGLHVTSTTTGGHNTGSKHYIGHAVDFRTRDMSDAYFQHICRAATAAGYRVRDERQRPAHQRVWAGPHGHLETLD